MGEGAPGHPQGEGPVREGPQARNEGEGGELGDRKSGRMNESRESGVQSETEPRGAPRVRSPRGRGHLRRKGWGSPLTRASRLSRAEGEAAGGARAGTG